MQLSNFFKRHQWQKCWDFQHATLISISSSNYWSIKRKKNNTYIITTHWLPAYKLASVEHSVTIVVEKTFCMTLSYTPNTDRVASIESVFIPILYYQNHKNQRLYKRKSREGVVNTLFGRHVTKSSSGGHRLRIMLQHNFEGNKILNSANYVYYMSKF